MIGLLEESIKFLNSMESAMSDISMEFAKAKLASHSGRGLKAKA